MYNRFSRATHGFWPQLNNQAKADRNLVAITNNTTSEKTTSMKCTCTGLFPLNYAEYLRPQMCYVNAGMNWIVPLRWVDTGREASFKRRIFERSTSTSNIFYSNTICTVVIIIRDTCWGWWCWNCYIMYLCLYFKYGDFSMEWCTFKTKYYVTITKVSSSTSALMWFWLAFVDFWSRSAAVLVKMTSLHIKINQFSFIRNNS